MRITRSSWIAALAGVLLMASGAGATGWKGKGVDDGWAGKKRPSLCFDGDCEDVKRSGRDKHGKDGKGPLPWPLKHDDRDPRPDPGTPIPEPSGFLIFALSALLLGGPLRRYVFETGDAPWLAADEPGAAGHALQTPTARRLKRTVDVALSTVGLLLALPVIALAALAIRFDTPGPALFAQTRCGRNGRRFTMWKIRTMVDGAEQQREALEAQNRMSGPVFKLESDPRVTRVGRVLRRFSIDELPQLWNVLTGDMSLVGPRPPLPSEVAQYGARERRRLEVDPGLTCTWQVSGRNRVDFDDWIRMDLDYIDGWSLLRDLALLAKTVPAVVRGDGAY